MSGDKVRLLKVRLKVRLLKVRLLKEDTGLLYQEADPIIIDYLRNLFMGAEEEEEMEFGTDEDKVNPKKSIPKIFC